MDVNTRKNLPSIIIILALLLVALLLVIFLAIPSSYKLKANLTRVAKARANATQAAQYIADIDGAYQKIAANTKAASLLALAAPKDADVANAVVMIDAIVTNSGLSLNALSPRQTSSGKTVITVTASGSYENLKKMITSLENNVRPMSADGISLVALEGGGEVLTAGNFSIDVTVGETSEE
ncbi:hypothetical protein KBB60_00550 [Patescibacteria group bacterium]|nr:hypothetical protein [Patescibacteria group bacterium]